jgi:hypothetical protein
LNEVVDKMILGARLLLFVLILDCFLYFGLGAIGMPEAANFGGQAGHFVNVDGSVDGDVNQYVNYSSGGTIVQASSFGYSVVGIDTIINFVRLIYDIMTVPMNFMYWIGAPLFAQVLVGVTYITMVLAAVAQLITGRFA